LTTLQDISLVPEDYDGKAAPSEIAFDRKMNFAYVARWLDDFMATFAVSPDGIVTMIGKTSCGERPRHLALDPADRWLLIANQDTDTIAIFCRDSKTGKLATRERHFPFPGRNAWYFFRWRQFPAAISRMQENSVVRQWYFCI
jgi:6-phosphogluconolactonase